MANSAFIPAPLVVTGLPEAPVDGAYRLKTDGNGTFLQLKDSATGEWRSVFVTTVNGQTQLAIGPAEE